METIDNVIAGLEEDLAIVDNALAEQVSKNEQLLKHLEVLEGQMTLAEEGVADGTEEEMAQARQQIAA